MKTERVEMMVEIYESADCVKVHDFRTETNTHQPLQRTGSDSVRNRSSRAAAVCLVLLLLTPVIVLCVHIHTKSTNYTEERNKLLNKITNLTEERDGLTIKNKNLTNERDQLRNELQICAEWTCYQSRFYFMSKEKKNWTESRRYCTERGADLIIINNTEERDFVKNMSDGTSVWIGLTDSDVENRWKWVDGSPLNSDFRFWASGEPNGQTSENCVVAVDHDQRWPNLSGGLDFACNGAFQWICEKRISQLILP